MIMMAKGYSGTLAGVKLPDICLTGEEKPRKNLIKETCPDRGSNPGPLRDRRAKGEWDLRISELVKNPDGTDI